MRSAKNQATIHQQRLKVITKEELYQKAISVIIVANKASTSLLQRRLSVGYGTAARIVDRLELEGLVGPPTENARPREIYRNKCMSSLEATEEEVSAAMNLTQ